MSVVQVHGKTAALAVPQHVRDEYLPASARELIVKGIPPNTLKAYTLQWKAFRLWCEQVGRTYAPVSQETMITYVDRWRSRPIHTRCTCSEHRPSPATMWIWYSAVRFYHGVGQPPIPWECGELLTRAMMGYSVEMVEGGWTPRKAPRAYPDDVKAMVDALDLSNPKHLRDRALILVGLYTAARSSDLATYRLSDIGRTPRGIELSLRMSKTNRRVGRLVETRTVFANNARPRYCGVHALDTWTRWLADEHDVTRGALFRPFDRWGNLVRSAETDAVGYRMNGVSVSRAVRDAAQLAGLPGGGDYTCHSLRRGRATDLREKGVDPIDIARAHGWVPGGSILTYLEEADRWAAVAPGAVGLL